MERAFCTQMKSILGGIEKGLFSVDAVFQIDLIRYDTQVGQEYLRTGMVTQLYVEGVS